MRALRRAPALAAALLLAGCSVDVEGAPCRVPWQGGDCPDGQACGNDLRCSTRALSCAAAGAHCVPGAQSECVAVPVDAGPDHVASRHCTAEDPVCGLRVVEDCTARQGMVCGQRDAAAALCECPDATGPIALVADATLGSPDARRPPFPRGVGPPECRFGNLWDAMEWTSILFGVGGASVTATGVFTRRADNSWPLTVGTSKTLRAAAGAAPVLRVDPQGVSTSGDTSQALIVVQGVLDGLAVEGATSVATGVKLRCGAGVPEVRNVAVRGGGTLTFGIVVGGIGGPGNACGGMVVNARVTGADTGLSLEPDPTGLATVLGGIFSGNRDGIRLRRGTMTIDADPATSTTKVRVEGNSGRGVVLDYNSAASVFDATLRLLDIDGNGREGIAWEANSLPSAAKLRFRSCTIHGNFKTATGDTAGGVSLPAEATSISLLELTGSSIWSNGGAQLSLFASPTVAAFGTDACGADANWIGGCGEAISISNPSATWLDVYGTYFSTLNGNVRRAAGSLSCVRTDFPSPPTCE